MEAKLKEFEDLIRAQSESKSEGKKQSDAAASGVHHHTVESVADSTESAPSKASKPVPDFEKLKQESIEQQLIVREFFTARGAKQLFGDDKTKKKKKNKKSEEQNDDDDEDPAERVTIIDENNIDDTGEFDEKLIFRIKETNEEIARVFPTVDSKSQTKIRRKIFYEKLVKRFFLLVLKIYKKEVI